VICWSGGEIVLLARWFSALSPLSVRNAKDRTLDSVRSLGMTLARSARSG